MIVVWTMKLQDPIPKMHNICGKNYIQQFILQRIFMIWIPARRLELYPRNRQVLLLSKLSNLWSQPWDSPKETPPRWTVLATSYINDSGNGRDTWAHETVFVNNGNIMLLSFFSMFYAVLTWGHRVRNSSFTQRNGAGFCHMQWSTNTMTQLASWLYFTQMFYACNKWNLR